MHSISVTVGAELFRFSTFWDWVNNARWRFGDAGVTGRDVICVDGLGRICLSGKEFMRARDENQFPIIVYSALLPETNEKLATTGENHG